LPTLGRIGIGYHARYVSICVSDVCIFFLFLCWILIGGSVSDTGYDATLPYRGNVASGGWGRKKILFPQIHHLALGIVLPADLPTWRAAAMDAEEEEGRGRRIGGGAAPPVHTTRMNTSLSRGATASTSPKATTSRSGYNSSTKPIERQGRSSLAAETAVQPMV